MYPIAQRVSLLPTILIFGGMFEFLYVCVSVIAPLPGLHFNTTPLAEAWPWLLIPSHFLLSMMGTLSHQYWFSILLLSITLVALVCSYMFMGRRVAGMKPERSGFLMLVTGTAVFGLTLLLQPSLFSDDVFTYIFSGRLLAIYHVDPMNTAPLQFPQDLYLRWVTTGRATPNMYGPLWLFIVSVLVQVSNSPVVTLLLFKGIALISHVLNCVLVWCILSKVAPGRCLLGTFLYAWNPLVLIELAGSGHNDGLLLTLLLLATWLCIQRKDGWRLVVGMLLFGLAICLNLIAILSAPLYIWFIVHTKQSISHRLWSFCWRFLMIVLFVFAIYLPFWRGPSTFFAITSVLDMSHFVHSPVGILVQPTRAFFRLVALEAHFPAIMQPEIAADLALRTSSIFIFILIYLHFFGYIRHTVLVHQVGTDQAMQLSHIEALLTSWVYALFWYLVLASGWFWPWYTVWIVWIVVIRSFDSLTISILLLSGTALLTYPFLGLASPLVATYQPIFIFGIPLAYLLWDRRRQAERNEAAR